MVDLSHLSPEDFARVEERAIELCRQAGIDPHWLAIVDQDQFGVIREPNWMMFADEAMEQLPSCSQFTA